MIEKIIGVHIFISGVVQGVGFRPFIFNLANRLGVNGWVYNTSSGVEIKVDGDSSKIETFIKTIRENPPSLAMIDRMDVNYCQPSYFSDFTILHSSEKVDGYQPISPDVAICDDCIKELLDPTNRRYHYPFINCTNCGPRFTIIQDIPYDRPNTTMKLFEMCTECYSEYNNPMDRRFHAQPIACPTCGPHYSLENKKGEKICNDDEIFYMTAELLNSGKIIAIKGIGGFHLACDAFNSGAVNELRKRKLRVDKPFAVLMPDLKTIEMNCFVSDAEKMLLSSRERPIVILRKKEDSKISNATAPGQSTLGIMLPYNPLHYVLFSPEYNLGKKFNSIALIMTSGNISEEPIAVDNQEARERLSNIADYFLMHNRPIHTRCDDSVLRIFQPDSNYKKNKTEKFDQKNTYPLRRSRGFAPYPVHLAWETVPMLACGGELKNTFCLTKNKYAFISHHIGDLENFETLKSYKDSINLYEYLFNLKPQVIAHDLHPDYLSTKYALKRSSENSIHSFGVQHHHAHIAACMAESQLPGDNNVIGFAFDGTGYGLDGTIWGGEVLLANYKSFTRVGHVDYFPLPGNIKAIKEPWRLSISLLLKAGVDFDERILSMRGVVTQEEIEVIKRVITNKINSPVTSSMGRLFDAVASLIGIRHFINYEGQAAIELEAIADPLENTLYDNWVDQATDNSNHFIIKTDELIKGVVSDILQKKSASVISAKFHNSIAMIVQTISIKLRELTGLSQVVLSGGVWQNMVLLEKTYNLLKARNFEVLVHRKVPANDGGISLGQAAIASHIVSE